MIPLLLRTFYRPLLNRVFRLVLMEQPVSREEGARFPFIARDVESILRKTWDRYAKLAGDIPQVSNLGGRLNLNLACLTLCAFHSLLECDVGRTHAIRIVSEVTWRTYRQWGSITLFISRLFTKHKARRIQFATRAFQLFPFSPPAYRIDRIVRTNGVDLNVNRCAVAEYFIANNAADLCTGSWCNLDFPLAEMWGGHLERTQTLVKGADYCDFKFRVGSSRDQKVS